jgi:hypothetical protein
MDANRVELRLPDCFDSGLLRPRYFARQLLTEHDMKAEQDYFREKQRRHNRFLHGWGCVCGLEVVPASTVAAPFRVRIESGYALGPFGDEIFLADSFFLDLAQCGPGTATDPCEPSVLRRPTSATGQQVFVVIRYAECLARPVRVMPAGCACDEEACEYSRIRDSFQIECLTELPPSHQPPPGPTLCETIQGQHLPVCPPCPTEPWVVLAQIELPASPTTEVTAAMIDNFTFRRQVFSTAVLQEQLIRCCCQNELADLAIRFSEITEVVDPNGLLRSVTYVIRVTNNGNSVARNIVVMDEVNVTGGSIASVIGREISRGEWTDTEPTLPASGATFTAELPELSSQETATLVLALAFRGTRENQPVVESTATASSDTSDPDSTNNSASVISPRTTPGRGSGNFVNP